MDIKEYSHEHHFDQHKPKAGEKRTWYVIVLTGITMVGEILAGLLFGSMALLADGLHMASHATALTISAMAYVYARKNAQNRRFTFGTGKVGSLAGFTSAVLLALFALLMVVESIGRFIKPVGIAFDEAIIVAVLGLIVNVISVFILNVKGHMQTEDHTDHHHDQNLRAAYLHVLADTLTSVLAIFALLSGKLLGLAWMDPLMGIIGAVMVTRWSIGLLGDTSRVLLDFQAPDELVNKVRNLLEKNGHTKVTDLHIWVIGSDQYAATIELVTQNTDYDSHFYLQFLREVKNIVHVTVSVHQAAGRVVTN